MTTVDRSVFHEIVETVRKKPLDEAEKSIRRFYEMLHGTPPKDDEPTDRNTNQGARDK